MQIRETYHCELELPRAGARLQLDRYWHGSIWPRRALTRYRSTVSSCSRRAPSRRIDDVDSRLLSPLGCLFGPFEIRRGKRSRLCTGVHLPRCDLPTTYNLINTLHNGSLASCRNRYARDAFRVRCHLFYRKHPDRVAETNQVG